MDQSPQQGQKASLESLSREEIINKYKGLLSIAKKAKQAKDDILEENRKLKEQIQQHETQKEFDKKAQITMKEMLEAYTENKLQLTIQLSDLQKHRRIDLENIEKLTIENESLKRQLSRLSDDNDSLLADIEVMENLLQQEKQKKLELAAQNQDHHHLNEPLGNNEKLLRDNEDLAKALNELKEKYTFVKEVNSEQRQKFNTLKDRFIEVHKKLKKLKECKRILLETQHEYADSVSQWQKEIIKASKLLCKELNDLKVENTNLLEKLEQRSKSNCVTETSHICVGKLNELLQLSEKVKFDYNCLKQENVSLKQKVSQSTKATFPIGVSVASDKLNELWQLSNVALRDYKVMQENYFQLKKENIIIPNQSVDDISFNIITKLEVLKHIADKAYVEYNQQSEELAALKLNFEELKNNKLDLTMCEQTVAKLQCSEDTLKVLQQGNINLIENSNSKSSENGELMKLRDDINKLALEKSNLQCLVNKMSSSCSKQESESINEFKGQLLTLQQSLEEYKKQYEQKEKEHYELLDEMRELNEALKVRGDFISRQQEDQQLLKTDLKNYTDQLQTLQQQIHEQDEELEIKHLKLASAYTTIEEANRKIESLETTGSLNEEKLRILSIELETIKSTQSNTDIDNQSEIMSTSTISKVDEMQRIKDIDDSFEDKYNKLRGLAAKLKKKLQEEIRQKQQLEKELYTLKSRESETKTHLAELQLKCSEGDSLKSQLSEKQKQIDNLKNENQKLKSSRKQANVLNLEIEAAEKSLTDVTNKLAARTSELDAAQELLRAKESSICQLRKEIELLESSKSAETKHSQDLRDQINHLQSTLKDAVYSKQQAFDKTKTLEQDVENLKIDLESVRLDMATATSNLEKSLNLIKSEKELLSSQLSTTQASLSEYEHKAKQAERAAEDLKVEYVDYKVKAQAVLRKNQTRDSSKERELEEELLSVRTCETQLKATVETLSSKLEELEKEKELVTLDNASLQIRSKELMQLIEEMRLQNDALHHEIQKHIQQQHETLKQHHQQIYSMDNCHKEQLQSVNTNHQRQMEQLRKEVTANVRLTPIVGASKLYSHTTDSFQLLDQTKLDFLLMEREDAEGSEEAAETFANLAASRKISNASSSIAKHSHQDFIPLEELLNTPINAISCETLITTPTLQPDNTKNTTDLLQLELNSTKERLQKQESRVRHLTALLAENEQDLAKLTQMNDMLKEELRRHERSVEREQHMHNSEYIKNIIMKFLTLNNADEKTRLVPVLNTILKLSRSETEMLNCVAKGQKDSLQQRGSGWGNFLPWGGSSSSSSNN